MRQNSLRSALPWRIFLFMGSATGAAELEKKMATVSLSQMRIAAKEWNSAWRTYAIATNEGGFVTSWNSDRYPRMRDFLKRCVPA